MLTKQAYESRSNGPVFARLQHKGIHGESWLSFAATDDNRRLGLPQLLRRLFNRQWNMPFVPGDLHMRNMVRDIRNKE